jgi:hypothetical protein
MSWLFFVCVIKILLPLSKLQLGSHEPDSFILQVLAVGALLLNAFRQSCDTNTARHVLGRSGECE